MTDIVKQAKNNLRYVEWIIFVNYLDYYKDVILIGQCPGFWKPTFISCVVLVLAYLRSPMAIFSSNLENNCGLGITVLLAK